MDTGRPPDAPDRLTGPFATAVTVLHDVAVKLPRAHTTAWWPGSGAPNASRAGANRTRRPGPVLAPGDPPTMWKYRVFLLDVAGLEQQIRRIVGYGRWPLLSATTAPHVVVARVAHLARTLARIADASDDVVVEITARARRLASHLDAILPPDPSKQRDRTVCRNPRDREHCSGFATNHRRQLCRSCENHDQYRRRRAARVTTR